MIQLSDTDETEWSRGWIVLWGVGLALLVCCTGVGCTQNVQRIDLDDETIPVSARNLVADAEDSIAIAKAQRDEAQRELRETRQWRKELLGRDWPSGASSAVRDLERLADGRVRLAELEVERARENVEYARAKFDLITAKTAIRNDLAVYRLDPIRRRVDREKADVDELDVKIDEQRRKIAQLENSWWDAYASLAKEEGATRALFVSSAGELPSPKLRSPEEKEGDEGEGDESDSGE